MAYYLTIFKTSLKNNFNPTRHTMNSKIEEIMNIAQEECAEVIQMISKVRRFGIDTTHLKAGVPNRAMLTEEIGDLLAMIELLVENNVITAQGLEAAKMAKFAKLKLWSSIYD
jgi:NTP pyrophosphatase (non-canonical NTP hydrolase)